MAIILGQSASSRCLISSLTFNYTPLQRPEAQFQDGFEAGGGHRANFSRSQTHFRSRAGDDPEVALAALQQTLGHKDIRTTMNYTHPSRSAMMRVVEAQETETGDSGHTEVTQQKREAS